MTKMYGIKRDFDCIGIYVDEPEKFLKQIQKLKKDGSYLLM